MKNLLPAKEYKILKKLNSPVKIQNFLNELAINFEPDGDTVLSPMSVLEKGVCHCMEAAALAALALRVHGYPPLVMRLIANDFDFDHVVTLFKRMGSGVRFPKPITPFCAIANRFIIRFANWR